MSNEVRVELLKDSVPQYGSKGETVEVSSDVAKSFVRHGIAKRVVAPKKTPGAGAEKRQTRTTSPKKKAAKE